MLDKPQTSSPLDISHNSCNGDAHSDDERAPSPQFEPVIQLPLVPTNTNEDDEDDLINM